MSLESESYALLSWKRFDEEVTDELLRAVTSAFALIAVADGDLAAAEDSQFLTVLRDHQDVFAPLDLDLVDLLFRDICGAILGDPAAGRKHALKEVAAVKGNAVHAELVRAAAEIAVAADQRVLAAETQLMQDICKALNLSQRPA